MDAVRTSETPVNFYQTTPSNIPEDSHLQIRGMLFTIQFNIFRLPVPFLKTWNKYPLGIMPIQGASVDVHSSENNWLRKKRKHDEKMNA
jgi:hypothetical protein